MVSLVFEFNTTVPVRPNPHALAQDQDLAPGDFKPTKKAAPATQKRYRDYRRFCLEQFHAHGCGRARGWVMRRSSVPDSTIPVLFLVRSVPPT